jgi:penicillin-binding protein 1A
LIFRSGRHIGKVDKSKTSVGAAYQAKKSQRKKFTSSFKTIAFVFFVLFSIGFLFISGRIMHLSKTLPDVNKIDTYIPSETTKIYSSDGVVLAELHSEENRDTIEIEKISPILVKSVIALEDSDFYKHHGLNFKGILRALYKDVMARKFVEGGSTLTQQLARNLFLDKRKKIDRKLSEMILALQIERKYTKTEILRMYLNQVYWGHNAYGIESASNMFFGKNARNLTLAEAAVLVGMLPSPETYSPFKNYNLSKKRQKIVLFRMAELGIITKQMARTAYNEKLVFKKRKVLRYKAPYFTSYVVQRLIGMYGKEATYTSGMKIYTTLDYELQQKAQEVVKYYAEYAKKPCYINEKTGTVPSLNFTEAAILAVDPITGYIKVMQGGVDFLSNQFNHCLQAKRQPGSAFKPIVYLSALEKGFSPGTYLDDSPVTYNTIEGPYSPQNYTKKFLGPISLRRALQKSVNVVAIKINHLVGPKNVVRVARQLGITSHLKPILSLPLGANEVTMLELASVYAVLANDGRRVEPVTIIKIEDRDGTTLYEHSIREKKVFDSNLIHALVEMMKGVVKYGTGKVANLPRPVAGKTGTTSDYKDAWFFGFVPQLVCAAWVGNDNNAPMRNITGGWVPAMMWRDFMKKALADIPPRDFPRPTGLVQRKINKDNGKLANEFTPEDMIVVEKYWKGSEPSEQDTQKDSLINSKNSNMILDFFKD